ncbi:MAG: PqqD family peptide modification chaperone [Lentisphaeria bacterium]|nr:PqqD family peptide modification chaperone [Lentisphaeria bacterium]
MKLHPDVFLRKEFDDSGILMRRSDGKVFYLNPISVLICEVLESNVDEATVIQHVRDHVKGVPENLADDVHAFLSQLRGAGLITEEE